MSEISSDDFALLTDIAIEINSAINLLDAWAEKNYIFEVSIIVERIKPKAKLLNKIVQRS